MARRPFIAAAVAVGALLVVGSCGERNGAPATPSSSPRPSASTSIVVEPSAGPTSIGNKALGGDVSTIVTFPSRTEPFDFGNQLNGLYRDTLRRTPVATFVDLEGFIVWIQEYLRYRVNGCSHTEAISRVISQISGGGVLPVCAEALSGPVAFPSRDQSVEFGNRLNAFYRDTLRRSSVSTFVDLEGWIVWIQEYLRYRVNSCIHSDAVSKVFTQITGGGVQPVCFVGPQPTPSPSATSFAGTWRGQVRSTSCSSDGSLGGFCLANPILFDSLTLTLNQSGSNVSGSINVGGVIASASGTAQGNRLVISGTTTSGGASISYEAWDTSLSGSSMVGGFTIRIFVSSGSVRYVMALMSVSRSSSTTLLAPEVLEEATRRISSVIKNVSLAIRP